MQCNRWFKSEFYAAICSFCVNAVVLAAAQILQEPLRLLFEFTARLASFLEMSDKQDDVAADLCSVVPAG